MKKYPALIALALIIGFATYEGGQILRMRRESRALQAELVRRENEVRKSRNDLARASAEWHSTQQRLATVRTEENASGSEAATFLKSWFQKMATLKAVFAEHPDQSIPELRLLTAMDWLTLSRDAEFQTDDGFRFTLAMVRRYAAQHFTKMLGDALLEYKKTHAEWPRAPSELAPYLAIPMEPAMFDRYKMMISGKIAPSPLPLEIIAESAPVDRAYDWRLVVSLDGKTSITAMREAPLLEATQKAELEYARAHDGRLTNSPKEYLPYIESPVLRAVIQAQDDWVQKSLGHTFKDFGDLLPYLHTDEARNLAEEFWPKRKWDQ